MILLRYTTPFSTYFVAAIGTHRMQTRGAYPVSQGRAIPHEGADWTAEYEPPTVSKGTAGLPGRRPLCPEELNNHYCDAHRYCFGAVP